MVQQIKSYLKTFEKCWEQIRAIFNLNLWLKFGKKLKANISRAIKYFKLCDTNAKIIQESI